MSEMNLGALLADTARREENDDVELYRERAALSEQAAAEFKVIEGFFTSAQELLTRQIKDRVPTADVGIQVGNGQMDDAYDALKLVNGGGDVPASMQKQHTIACLFWRQFNAWASANGLRPKWLRKHDGGGMSGWYWLTVEPLHATKR